MHLDRVVFNEIIVKREFPMMSIWNTEDIKKRVENEVRSYGFRRGVVEPCLNVLHLTLTDHLLAKDLGTSEIEPVNKTYLSYMY